MVARYRAEGAYSAAGRFGNPSVGVGQCGQD